MIRFWRCVRFQYSGLIYLLPIRNWNAYPNEATIVNKDSPDSSIDSGIKLKQTLYHRLSSKEEQFSWRIGPQYVEADPQRTTWVKNTRKSIWQWQARVLQHVWALYTWILMRHFALLFIVYIIIQMCKDTRDAHQNKLEYSTIRTHRWFNLKGWHGKISETGFFSLIATVCVEKDDWTVIEDYSVKKEVVKLIGLNSIFVGSQSCCLFAAKTDKPSTTL